MLRSISRFSSLSRSFSEKLRPELVEKLISMDVETTDARAFRNISYQEIKDSVTPEMWAKFMKNDPLKQFPELAQFPNVDDLLPQKDPRLPPHLTRPAFLLTQRQLEAQKMTLEFSKKEYKLKQQMDAAVDAFQALTTDGYEVNIGLVVCREPVFMSIHPRDQAFAQVRHKVWGAHKMYMEAELSLTEYDYVEDEAANEDDVRRRHIAKKRIAEGKPYEYVPTSLHYLEVDPNASDPHSIQVAPGNRVYLLFRDKLQQKWLFPSLPALGRRRVQQIKDDISTKLLLDQLKLHHLGPMPLFHDQREYGLVRTVQRPKTFEEEVFEMYFKRTKLLFPHALDEEIDRYLMTVQKLKKESEPLEKQLRGSKSFYFQSILTKGLIKSLPEQFDDWAWVPKARLSHYLTKEEYEKIDSVAANY